MARNLACHTKLFGLYPEGSGGSEQGFAFVRQPGAFSQYGTLSGVKKNSPQTIS